MMASILNQKAEIAREKLTQKAIQKSLDSPETTDNSQPFQGLLFVGNRHETVPLRLLTDKYLSPRAKTAWQMIKLNAYQFQGSIFPSYNELALWLSDRAFQGKAVSRKIVSQTLLLLRLTRWLTLCETVRNEKGQVLGNVYVMNDEPLSVADCLHLNGDYLRLLEKSAKHQDPLVKEVAMAIIDEMLTQDKLWYLCSHIPVIQARFEQLQQQTMSVLLQAVKIPENLAKTVEATKQKLFTSVAENALSSKMERSKKSRELSQKSEKSLSSKMELSQGTQSEANKINLVPNRNSYSTCTVLSTKGTVLEQLSTIHLTKWQALQLKPREEMQMLELLNSFEPAMQQAIVIEFIERCGSGSIQKPVGYFRSIVTRAKTGEFTPYFASQQQAELRSTKTVPQASVKPLAQRLFDAPVSLTDEEIKARTEYKQTRVREIAAQLRMNLH